MELSVILFAQLKILSIGYIYNVVLHANILTLYGNSNVLIICLVKLYREKYEEFCDD